MTQHPLPSSAHHVEHKPLSRLIYEWLRGAILRGELAPGQVLRQESLAQRFSASRVPLREALNHLEAEGLVVLRPRRGYAVTSLDVPELLEVMQLRIVIEEHVGYVATLKRTAEDVQKLDACLSAMEQLPMQRLSRAEVGTLAALNQEFHDTLAGASRRKYLRQLAANLRIKIEPYIRMEVSLSRDFEEAHRDHKDIAAAFREGDATAVARLLRQHSEHTAVRLVEELHKNGLAQDLTLHDVTNIGPTAPRRPLKRTPPE